METRYAVIKVEVQVILLRSRGIFYLDLFIFLFFKERCVSFCVFEGNFILQNSYYI